jgi:hypothetical protein
MMVSIDKFFIYRIYINYSLLVNDFNRPKSQNKSLLIKTSNFIKGKYFVFILKQQMKCILIFSLTNLDKSSKVFKRSQMNSNSGGKYKHLLHKSQNFNKI